MDPIVRNLLENLKNSSTERSVVGARSNFLKSIYENLNDCTSIIKDLPSLLERDPSIVVSNEFTNSERHPEFSDKLFESELIISPAKAFEEVNGVLTAVLSVNSKENHYISDTITTDELVSRFNSQLASNPSKAFKDLVDTTVTYRTVPDSDSYNSVYTVSALVSPGSTPTEYNVVTFDDISAGSDREAFSKYSTRIKEQYNNDPVDVFNMKVTDIKNKKSIIRPELHNVSTANAPNISEGTNILECTVKVFGMEDRVFKDTKATSDYITNLSESLIRGNRLRVNDIYGNDITSEFLK